jgi:hypothetical protein
MVLLTSRYHVYGSLCTVLGILPSQWGRKSGTPPSQPCTSCCTLALGHSGRVRSGLSYLTVPWGWQSDTAVIAGAADEACVMVAVAVTVTV